MCWKCAKMMAGFIRWVNIVFLNNFSILHFSAVVLCDFENVMKTFSPWEY